MKYVLALSLLLTVAGSLYSAANDVPNSAGTTSVNRTALPLPIRVVCGSASQIGSFIPDPDMPDGAENHADSPIDTSAPNAGPLAIYQYERWGNDFSYHFPVPKEGHYVVRLHFAEIFDSPQERFENVYINGQCVLPNLDIASAAKGENVAMIREFRNINTDDQSNITIRVAATRDSPDQNSKISGIEILRQGTEDEKSPTPTTFNFETSDAKATFTVDISGAPEMEPWARHELSPVLATWYPKISTALQSDGSSAPSHIMIILGPYPGVAATSGNNIVASSHYLNSEMKRLGTNAAGVLVHECVHVVQSYSGHDSSTPGWLVEGMADYFRWFQYEPQNHGADLIWMKSQKNLHPQYDGSYRITANFLDWVSRTYDPHIVPEVNAELRKGTYTDAFWAQHTGKSILTLNSEWLQYLKT